MLFGAGLGLYRESGSFCWKPLPLMSAIHLELGSSALVTSFCLARGAEEMCPNLRPIAPGGGTKRG